MSVSDTYFDDIAGADVPLPAAVIEAEVLREPAGCAEKDFLADEVPVSLVYNGISHAVMMTTPREIEDFAVGFSLTEEIVPSVDAIYNVQIRQACNGLEANLEIAPEFFWKLKDVRRSMAGRTGCGICGTESLEGVYKKTRFLPVAQHFSLKHYHAGFEAVKAAQVIGAMTGCTHAACMLTPDGTVLGGCEDVGRHVALDKLIGKAARGRWEKGPVFLSSRASFEMVQKAAVFGIEILFAISAPTNKAVELAKSSGITLSAFCRDRRFNVYTYPERLLDTIEG
jgi:FdhD protein